MKLQYEYLLEKTDTAQYITPCGKYEILYTNYGWVGDVVWMAKAKDGSKITAQNLQSLLLKIVDDNPHMTMKLYKILYNL